MTPQEENENEKLAVWAGIECRCKETPPFLEILKQLPFTTVTTCKLHPTPPDYDRDEVAVSLLPVMVGHGYVCQLDCSALGYRVRYALDDGYNCPWHYTAYSTTIAAAIKAACLQLVEKEML